MSHSAHSLSLYITKTPSPILIHCRLPFPILIYCRTHSSRAQNRKAVGGQSESSTRNPKLRQPIRIEYYVTRKHPRALGYGWRPFSALGSIRLAIAYLNTWGLQPLPPPPLDLLTTLLLSFLVWKNDRFYRKLELFSCVVSSILDWLWK